MEQFSHDLSLALEETSRITGSRNGRWTVRRRTRSTGNLPCAPQPTEDSSSSSPEDSQPPHGHPPQHAVNASTVTHNICIKSAVDGASATGHLLSDSDNPNTTSRSSATRFPLSVVARPDVSLGNFESDSLNETFSPARPCARRKRKFKRMAVEYDTPTTATAATALGVLNSVGFGAGANIFPIEGRARVSSYSGVSHRPVTTRFGSCQENFRSNGLFCGKRKRSHRDRYEYDHHRSSGSGHVHSSSVPRGNLATSVSTNHHHHHQPVIKSHCRLPGDKIQPLNMNIISRIEKITADSALRTSTIPLPMRVPRPECEFKPIPLNDHLDPEEEDEEDEEETMTGSSHNHHNNISIPGDHALSNGTSKATSAAGGLLGKPFGSLESNFSFQEYGSCSGNSSVLNAQHDRPPTTATTTKRHTRRHRHKRSAMGLQPLQFDDPSMDCPMEDILSSSSLSSSDSETDKTCDSDREGDDELTDWPGHNEQGTNNSMTTSSGGSEPFKRTKSQKGVKGLPLIKSDDTQDEDTRMSGDDTMSSLRMQPVVLPLKPGFVPVTNSSLLMDRSQPSMPIDMPLGGGGGGVTSGMDMTGGVTSMLGPQTGIESEMSGETSNHFLSSSPNALHREFRAGCRRVREERPSFSVITSVSEDLSRFLQDRRQTELHLPDTDIGEHEKLVHLAKLYSLHMRVDRGIAILTKTSNTTQPVRVDRSHMSKRYLSDYKRRCYEDQPPSTGIAQESATNTTEEQEMNDIQ